MLQHPTDEMVAASMAQAAAAQTPLGTSSGAGGGQPLAKLGMMLTPRGSVVQKPRKRFGEPLKMLPVAFVAFTILTLYCVYVFCHCVPKLQLSVATRLVDLQLQDDAIRQLVAFHIITPMLLLCYIRSVLVHPGEIPNEDPQWEYKARDMRGTSGVDASGPMVNETKKSGERRHCKWCSKFKPDRCHHCRVCKTCILKMDHHCPWIYNCVGFRNYKCFFLLLFYSVLDCHLIFWTMQETVIKAVQHELSFFRMFLLFFGQTLTFFVGTLVTAFFCFHIWLMLRSMTTIEFCEKSLSKKKEASEGKGYDTSLYDLGVLGNIRAVLGDNPFLWLVPCATALPSGDGLNFMSDETRLTMDMETGKNMRNRGHQRTQRSPQLLLGHDAYQEYAGYGMYASAYSDEAYLQGFAAGAGYGSTQQLSPIYSEQQLSPHYQHRSAAGQQQQGHFQDVPR